MSKVLVTKDKLDILANAIANKSGEPLTLTLDEMVSAVDGIETGGGGITPTGNINITQAGVTDVTNYATATVPDNAVIDSGINGSFKTINGARKWDAMAWFNYLQDGMVEGGINYASKSIRYDAVASGTTITPTTSSQTIGGANYMMEGAVTVAAMPEASLGVPVNSFNKTSTQLQIGKSFPNYTPGYLSGINTLYTPLQLEDKTVTPSTTSQTVTPTGNTYYLNSVTVDAMPTGVATSATTISGTAATVSTGTNTLTLTKTVSNTPRITTAGYISTGTAGNSSVTLTANVTTKAAATITPGTTNQTIASGTYLTGTQTIAGDADLVASNIVSGVQIFGVTGNVVLQNYYTGSSAPSSSTGSNGDLYLQS